ncbi:DUF2461 domain-containing protein [Empedobacter stercoris]|uniref:DUF2461 domain-containing protein n=1 Tax=Empedobacter stercoris TaxID=1628248 RepID=A0ABX1WKG7_9FLAO|nr:DUF2461 domain-containing protein [Empedobacter stercoris]MCA4809022.1 DUF2461 domain-containing protein [Empedobacter stercoris]NOJ75173.1 DUF2461 domain-containing protein [Empedobacter stercoris]QNT14156.1 DUF2461 domain-containing protein [Empedobacter stercoris]
MSNITNFLKQLEKNNNRDWFNTHKNEFDTAKAEADLIFNAIYQELSKKEELEPLKIYRIYRDVRFTNDKTPYKIHFSAQSGRKKPHNRGGYYFHIQPNHNFIGIGFWGPERDDLIRIRKDIEVSDELEKILQSKTLIKEFGEMQGEEVKSAPKGFSKDHERIALLRKKQYLFIKNFTDEEVLAEDFPKKVAKSIQVLQPFLNYMTEVLTTDENGQPLF